MDEDALEEALITLMKKGVVELPPDVITSLRIAYEKEDNEVARMQLSAILDNIALAKQTGKPLCQDTGIPLFFVTLSHTFSMPLTPIIRRAVAHATYTVPLRPNSVDPLTRVNPGTNVGNGMPSISYETHDKPYTDITFFPKGAGSENMSRMKMLTPSKGVTGVMEYVLDSIYDAGGKTCPPTIVGIGIGGSADICMRLAKKALLRPLGERNTDHSIAKLEENLETLLNEIGIGPMGMGGRTTVLGVHINTADCHTASLPVAINMQCWAARKATLRIHDSGEVEYV